MEEYLTGECVRGEGVPAVANRFAYETWRDWAGVNASQRPCYEPAVEAHQIYYGFASAPVEDLLEMRALEEDRQGIFQRRFRFEPL